MISQKGHRVGGGEKGKEYFRASFGIKRKMSHSKKFGVRRMTPMLGVHDYLLGKTAKSHLLTKGGGIVPNRRKKRHRGKRRKNPNIGRGGHGDLNRSEKDGSFPTELDRAFGRGRS